MGFAIRIGLHNSYDVILYVWRVTILEAKTTLEII